MLKRDKASDGLLFTSFLYRQDLYGQSDLVEHWDQKFGPVFLFEPKLNPLARYYSKEMGEEKLLKRFFIASVKKFPREFLLSTKILSLDWERSWSVSDKRMVNVDVGFLSAENFILATTKNYSHRIFLGQNIYADLTLHFHQGKFETLPWTYPDYKDEEKIEFLTWLRSYLIGS